MKKSNKTIRNLTSKHFVNILPLFTRKGGKRDDVTNNVKKSKRQKNEFENGSSSIVFDKNNKKPSSLFTSLVQGFPMSAPRTTRGPIDWLKCMVLESLYKPIFCASLSTKIF